MERRRIVSFPLFNDWQKHLRFTDFNCNILCGINGLKGYGKIMIT